MAIAAGGTIIVKIFCEDWPDWISFTLAGVFIGVGYTLLIFGLRRYREIATRIQVDSDMMTWNITRDGVTERMAVSPDRDWDVEGPGKKLAPDPTRTSEYTQFILDGALDVDEANAAWVKEFMARTGLTAEDLKRGG